MTEPEPADVLGEYNLCAYDTHSGEVVLDLFQRPSGGDDEVPSPAAMIMLALLTLEADGTVRDRLAELRLFGPKTNKDAEAAMEACINPTEI